MEQTYVGTLKVVECPNCHCAFGMTKEHEQRRRDDGGNFYCPNGHVMAYTKREIDKQRERAEKAESRVAFWQARADEHQRDARRERRFAIAQKAAKTRIKNRVGNGVCPCCNRTFTNLQRHMHNQHPDYAKEQA